MRILLILCILTFILSTKINKAASYLLKHGHKKSIYRCASYIASALLWAGFKFNRLGNAYQYYIKGVLRKLEFRQIKRGSPKKGDIYVQVITKSHIHGSYCYVLW